MVEKDIQALTIGSPCSTVDCHGYLRTYATEITRSGDMRIRRFCCPVCGGDHGKCLVPISMAPRRLRMRRRA